MGFADLHIHTTHSWDGICSVEQVLHTARQVGLNVIAITDHDETRGALAALDLAPHYGLEVIPGCEVSTREGHLLALFIERPVPAGLSFVETLLHIGEQGGLAIAPHPMARWTSSLSAGSIHRVLKNPSVAHLLAGIESYNASLFNARDNLAAHRLAESLSLPKVGSSDAHVAEMSGGGATEFDGQSAAELRQALYQELTRVRRRARLSAPHGVLLWLKYWLGARRRARPSSQSRKQPHTTPSRSAPYERPRSSG